MTLHTALTDALSLDHPIVLAPMGDCAGGALAAAVSEGGGLGMVGGGRGEAEWLERELTLVAASTARPWGVGFLSWGVDATTVARSLEYGPAAVMLSFGDPTPLAGTVRDAGATLIMQVTDLDEARQALDAGADVVVAQGTEAGGHGGRRATFPLVPAVVDLAGDVPVLAAGGIGDGRGLAAALALGAAGAVVGTRFQATPEAVAHEEVLAAIVEGSGDNTDRSRVLDIARGVPWPDRYTARTVGTAFVDRWRGREDELEADASARRSYFEAVERGELPPLPVWAGEAIDLITELAPAAELVGILAAEAEVALVRALRP